MSDNSQSDILPGSVSCIFCNKSINFVNEGKDKFFDHLRNEHMIFLNHNVVLAINFLDKDTLQVIVEQFETSYYRILQNENKKDSAAKNDNDKKVKNAESVLDEVKPSTKGGNAKKEECNKIENLKKKDKAEKLLEKMESVDEVETIKKVDRSKKMKNLKNKVTKMKKEVVIPNKAEKNKKVGGIGKIKILNTSLLQKSPEKTEKTIVVEDDEPLKEKATKVNKKKNDLMKQVNNGKKTTSFLKSHLNLVQRRKSAPTANPINSKTSSKNNKPLNQIRRHSFGGAKPAKRLNGSVGAKTLPQGLRIVKTVAPKSSSSVLPSLAGITVTKAVQPKPLNPSRVINLSTDNMIKIKEMAKNGNLGTKSGFSCAVCGKKFNTEERHKKHATNCVKANLKMNIGLSKLSGKII